MDAQGFDLPLWPDDPTADDLLGFADIAEPVITAIDRERLDPVAVGIFGDWGSGKSTILEIISAELRQRPDTIVVPTRPWEYDPALDPKATLIGEVLGRVSERAQETPSIWKNVKGRVETLARRVQWSKAFTVAASSAVTFTLPSMSDLADIFGKGDEPTELTLQGFRDEFNSVMTDLKDVQRVVVLVDDLDRCLPSTVVTSLEAIKLFLSVPKMAFVIAADRRLVELAIAQRFDGSARGADMAREYLEKIVQIPVSVPSLGLGDTEAYLSLMLLSHHVSDETLTALARHCDTRRKSAIADVFHDYPPELVPDGARADLALAGMLAPVLCERLNGNPRRLKRFLNAFWVRLAIAQRRGAAPEETALAKLMVLEMLDPDAFTQLLEWMADGTLSEKLAKIENGSLPADTNSAFESWAKIGPKLADLDLGPYLSLAASLRNRPGARPGFRSDLLPVLEGLESESSADRAAAARQFSELPVADRVLVVREMMNIIRVEPRRYERLAEAIERISQDADVSAEFVDGIRQLDPSRVDAGLIISMGGDHPAGEQTRPIVSEWLDSGQLGEVQQNAAREILQGGG